MEVVERVYSGVDVAVQHGLYEFLRRDFGVEVVSTPATKGLPFVDSPTPTVLSASLYLVVIVGGLLWITVGDLKPRAKEPGWLQALVLVHNLFCFALSLYMCVGIIYQAIVHGYSVWGNAYYPHHREIIMVLKRSTRQITFLHVYHHASISVIWWAIAHEVPGGDVYFSAALNAGVHVFMYGYYFLAALLRSKPKLRAKYLFWGRYLTQFQMFQFMLNLIHAYIIIKMKMPMPQYLVKTEFYYMISLLCLFGNFYFRKYIKSSKGDKIE
ncbi:hypothetical protein KC19_6G183300 [Ceratodon purpureus]|uniref:Very-long-chain 3-oxoacyl-CoA synthase n=1 Tax=Ceratodon purpureus TaxID=3225 RepID=A0A8T0HG36_CERPU|nr:hypothetical protein KC19_6G183300 [Ceratodon purpureus]